MQFNTVVTAAAPTKEYFAEAGFTRSRNNMVVEGEKLLFRAIEFAHPGMGDLHIVLNEEESAQDSLAEEINDRYPEARVFQANSRVAGALVSGLIACDNLDLEMPLLVVAGDSFLRQHVRHYLPSEVENLGAWTIAFKSGNPRWSYLSTNPDGAVSEVAEKEVTGDMATTGVFLFNRGQEFVNAAEWVLVNNARRNGRFFVSTALNYFISRDRRVGFTEIPRSDYYSYSTPADFVEQAV